MTRNRSHSHVRRGLAALAGTVAGLAVTGVTAASAAAASAGSLTSTVGGATSTLVSATASTTSTVVSSTASTASGVASGTASGASSVASATGQGSGGGSGASSDSGSPAPPTAATVNPNASGCNTTPTVSQPFAPWGDANYYDLVPGGSFEGTLAGWTLGGGAQPVAGSEPFAATGTLGSSSLYLPSGGSVQSPFFCVDASQPTFRFFAQNDASRGNLLAELVYQDGEGETITTVVGNVNQTPSWAPSAALPTGAALAAAADSNGSAEVALRFVARGGPSQIDDVFVDPRCK